MRQAQRYAARPRSSMTSLAPAGPSCTCACGAAAGAFSSPLTAVGKERPLGAVPHSPPPSPSRCQDLRVRSQPRRAQEKHFPLPVGKSVIKAL